MLSTIMMVTGLIYVLRVHVDDLRNKTIPRIHDRIEALTGEMRICVTADNANTRFDKIDGQLREMQSDIRNICIQVAKLKASMDNESGFS